MNNDPETTASNLGDRTLDRLSLVQIVEQLFRGKPLLIDFIGFMVDPDHHELNGHKLNPSAAVFRPDEGKKQGKSRQMLRFT